MNDLKSDYLEIEEYLNWPKRFKPESTGKGDQFYRLLTDLRGKVRDRSLQEKLEPIAYRDRLSTLYDCVWGLRSSLNYHRVHLAMASDEQHVWRHQPNDQITGLGKDSDELVIYRDLLLETAATYLANPWLQYDPIDWILFDSLIFAELSAYRDSIYSGQVLGKINWVYFWSGGKMRKALWFGGMFALLRYIVFPAFIAALYYFHFTKTSFSAGIIYVVCLFQHVIGQRILQSHLDRLRMMLDVYSNCNLPVISISTLRASLNKAVEAGAIYDGALFSLLKRIEETKGDVFTPFTKST